MSYVIFVTITLELVTLTIGHSDPRGQETASLFLHGPVASVQIRRARCPLSAVESGLEDLMGKESTSQAGVGGARL